MWKNHLEKKITQNNFYICKNFYIFDNFRWETYFRRDETRDAQLSAGYGCYKIVCWPKVFNSSYNSHLWVETLTSKQRPLVAKIFLKKLFGITIPTSSTIYHEEQIKKWSKILTNFAIRILIKWISGLYAIMVCLTLPNQTANYPKLWDIYV